MKRRPPAARKAPPGAAFTPERMRAWLHFMRPDDPPPDIAPALAQPPAEPHQEVPAAAPATTTGEPP